MPSSQFEPPRFLSSLQWTDGKLLLTCLGIGFLIRLIPELLAWPLPIGFDTIHYAVVMKSGVVLAHWSQFFTSSWLLYSFIVPLYGLTQIDPFLLLKIVAPLLYGLNVAGVYWFARKALRWSWQMSLVSGILFSLQFAALRISWDLLRNILGMGILLFALSYYKEVGSRKGFALFAILSLFSVFAHEYAAATLIAIVFGLAILSLFKKQVSTNIKSLALAALPSLTVFSVGLGLRIFPMQFTTVTNVINVGDTVSGKAGGMFFLVNYLSIQESVDSYGIYSNLALSVFVLFALLYLPFIFFAIKGYFKNVVLDAWTGLLIVGAFGCLVVPFFAFQYWHRWMFMIAYPFTFYTVSGIWYLKSRLHFRRQHLAGFLHNRFCLPLILAFGLSISYLATPLIVGAAQPAAPYITTVSLYFSVAPTVPYQDVNSVVSCMKWLEANMGASSCVILHNDFLDWGKLYLDKSHEIIYFINSIDAAINSASSNGFGRVFFVWWNQPMNWCVDLSVPNGFVSVQDFGRISVYANEV